MRTVDDILEQMVTIILGVGAVGDLPAACIAVHGSRQFTTREINQHIEAAMERAAEEAAPPPPFRNVVFIHGARP